MGEQYEHPIRHWKVSRDISYKPVGDRAPQGGDYGSDLTQALQRDGYRASAEGHERHKLSLSTMSRRHSQDKHKIFFGKLTPMSFIKLNVQPLVKLPTVVRLPNAAYGCAGRDRKQSFRCGGCDDAT